MQSFQYFDLYPNIFKQSNITSAFKKVTEAPKRAIVPCLKYFTCHC